MSVLLDDFMSDSHHPKAMLYVAPQARKYILAMPPSMDTYICVPIVRSDVHTSHDVPNNLQSSSSELEPSSPASPGKTWLTTVSASPRVADHVSVGRLEPLAAYKDVLPVWTNVPSLLEVMPSSSSKPTCSITFNDVLVNTFTNVLMRLL